MDLARLRVERERRNRQGGSVTRAPVTIRKAALGDAPGLAECMRQAYTTYVPRMGTQRLPPMDADYEDEIASYLTWVAESESEIVGGLTLVDEATHMTIANVAVRPDFQGSGLGRELMDLAEAEARDAGFSELRLATHVLLSENVSYYLHLGWLENGRDETRVYMKKAI